jgi:hypothetical protein
MTAAIRSEFRKFFTTRMWWGLLIPTALLGGLFAWLAASLIAGSPTGGPGGGTASFPGLDNPRMVSSVYTFGLSISRLILLAIGVLCIGAEYRHKTITGTFLATPVRTTVMGAKVISLLVIGALYGLVQTAASFGVGAAIIRSKGFEVLPDGALRSLALGLLVLGLWALIGLGAGILIPNQVAALLIAVGVAWIVEPLLTLVFSTQSWGEPLVPYMPSQATSAIVNSISDPNSTITPLSWQVASLVLLGYAVVLAGIGTIRTVRADIS